MTVAASEAASRGSLVRAISAAYPTPRIKRLVGLHVGRRGRMARLLEREEQLPPETLRALLLPELVDEAARPLRKLPRAGRSYRSISAYAMALYGIAAARELKRVTRQIDVYHFRAGFGQASIQQAKLAGAVALCDHAAVHPLLSDIAVTRHGWEPGQAPPSGELEDPVARRVLADLEQTDAWVVNSALIKQMFIDLGYPAERIHVVYLGIDDAFLGYVREADTQRRLDPLRMLFAGRFDRAKGADVLIAALAELKSFDWEFVIAGPIAEEVRRAHAGFLADPRVIELGTVHRRVLAGEMKAAAVFVFPSPSEGSARVVFEALAGGCYVITTPQAGSIVEHEIHGALIPPGDPGKLAQAILRASDDLEGVVEIGERNAILIARSFTQKDYGDALAAVYRDVTVTASVTGM